MDCLFEASGPGVSLDVALMFVSRWAFIAVGGAVGLGLMADWYPILRPLVRTVGVAVMVLSWYWAFYAWGILRDASRLPFQLPALFIGVASYLLVTFEDGRGRRTKSFFWTLGVLAALIALADAPLRDLGVECDTVLVGVEWAPPVAALCVIAWHWKWRRGSTAASGDRDSGTEGRGRARAG